MKNNMMIKKMLNSMSLNELTDMLNNNSKKNKWRHKK